MRLLMLLLPGLIPSWRFFQTIEPSPRVQWRVLDDAADDPNTWREYHPRPQHLSPARMLRRLVWNPNWNDALYLVSLSERLMEAPTRHSVSEIQRRVERAYPTDTPQPYLQFRLVFVRRKGTEISAEVTYVSEPWVRP